MSKISSKAITINILLLFLIITYPSFSCSTEGVKNTVNNKTGRFVQSSDTTQSLNKYNVPKNKLRPYIAPVALIATGTSLHFSTKIKNQVRNGIQKNFAWNGYIDDYVQYLPLVAVYTLYGSGIRGENNFGNKTAIAIKAFILNGILTYGLKTQVDALRPNGETRSFPSGHASKAFTLAHFMHHEYGGNSTWYSIGAYASATAVSAIRLAKDEHWVSDVIMGAGIGILSTELIYLTHQYKWDNQYLKKLNLFPFKNVAAKGFTLVYTF